MVDPALSIDVYRSNLEEGTLYGFECDSCGYKQITYLVNCPKCQSRDIDAFTCDGTGVLDSFTHQHVASELFKDAVPYAYVIVALDEGVKTSGYMRVDSIDELEVGLPVKLVASDDGNCHFEKQ